MTSRFQLTSLLAVAMLFMAPALAQADITVDPEGPAGKQYSDSLDEARAKTSGSDPSTAVPGATENPPLFGEGVTPAGGSSDGPGGGQGSGNGPGDVTPAKTTVPDDGDYGTPLAFLIAAGVAVFGVGAAFGAGKLHQPA